MMGTGNGRGGPPQQAKHVETNYKVDVEKHEAFWSWILVERLTLESKVVALSGSINELVSEVVSVGNGVAEEVDLLPGDRVVFGGQGACSLECKGPKGGTLIAVPMPAILTVDRTGRGVKPRLPPEQHAATRAIKKRVVEQAKASGEVTNKEESAS